MASMMVAAIGPNIENSRILAISTPIGVYTPIYMVMEHDKAPESILEPLENGLRYL